MTRWRAHDAAAGMGSGVPPRTGRDSARPPLPPRYSSTSSSAESTAFSASKSTGIVVERVIANFKNWRVLHTDYRRPLDTFATTISAAIGLMFYSLT